MNFLSFSSPLKRFYKFLLKRVLGQFLQYELDLNQLEVQLSQGEVTLRDLELNVQVRHTASNATQRAETEAKAREGQTSRDK